LEAKITLEYKDLKTASAIANAVSPDNFSAPSNLFIKTSIQKNQVFTEIRTEENLSTLIATIDDLLSCISTAEKTIHIILEKLQ
jgi:tRNA threonylcarbamoyladenosine modification (KEOPS) complex  Pcc1 subunit